MSRRCWHRSRRRQRPPTSSIIHQFCYQNLDAGLTLGGDGNLYGPSGGGAHGYGAVYKITPDGTKTEICAFDGTGGTEPKSKLLYASDGNLYGTASHGGEYDSGVIYRLSLNPVLTSATSATATLGQSFSYQIAASNAPTSFSAVGLPAGLSINATTGRITGTPTTAGSYKVTLRAVNSGGTGSATLTLVVKVAVPVITSALTATGQAGVAFGYQITASNGPTSYGATGLPVGLSVDPTTGKMSGKPTTAGTYSITVKAANSGGVGSATLSLVVKKAG